MKESLSAGTTISHYRLLSRLGAGGMGEVYLAEDTRLKRKVALKLLPTHFTSDADRVRRFEQEAQAASALNHPNIITIYEIGQEQGTHYIATEFIDGQTLRQRMTSERLSLGAALDIAIQTASALAAAHEAGIIHRDIKPENVMVRRDGIVKVLDFGLAKLTEQPGTEVDTNAPTIAKVTTDPGTVMGTASYMSPEQARGQKVDARTDLFSLGVVLYEMVAGRAPFEGLNAIEVMGAILNREPVPLRHHAPEVPAELERIVTKALEKDREERYQVMKDLLLDVKRLKQRLEFEAEQARTRQPEAARGAPVTASTAEVGAAHTTSSAEYLISEIKHHQRGVMLALLVFIIAGAGVAYWLSQSSGRTKPATSSQALKIMPLTSTGKATRAAISPDGKYVVYALDEGGHQSLWVTQVAAASNVQIVPPAEVNYRGLTFSRDGNFIYYVRDEKGTPGAMLYQAPVLGGAARKLLVGLDSPMTLSPDGQRLAFVRTYLSSKENALIVANADGTEEKKLVTRKPPDSFSRLSGPTWSPDGKLIACGYSNQTGGRYNHVVGVRVADGAERPITSQRWENVGPMAWLSDGSGLVVTAQEQVGSWPQIWHLSYPGDEARRMTSDLSGYMDISLTADSTTLATVRYDSFLNIWVAQDGDASCARQITSGAGRADGARGLSWTPDGKIVYWTVAGGNPHVWMMEADGTGNKQLSVTAVFR